MAKLAVINRQAKREAMVKKYAEKRKAREADTLTSPEHPRDE